jgi:hypothetical protein
MWSALALSLVLAAPAAATPDALRLVLDETSPGTAAPLAWPSLRLAPEGTAARGDGAAPAPGRTATLRWWGRTLRWSTAASLVVTSTLGTMVAMNQPTAFGDGRCITGDPVLGTYGCDRGLSTLHGSAAVLSVTLYTANAVLRLAAPESKGYVSEAARPWHTALSWVHLVGIVIQPVMGLVAAYPQVIGKSTTIPTDPFPRNLRTVHIFVGYITTAAFLTTTILEQ